MKQRRPCARILLLAGWIAACAVPVPPSGGPPDTDPPGLVSSEPADGAVGVRTDRVVLRFDEYVDERSIPGALSVTPAPSRPPDVRFGGREVELRFREPLRDSTTYILTIDTAFRDAHGVALEAPLRIAFSTGDTIDRARIAGRVVEWDRGAPAAGIDVFAHEGGTVPTDADPAYRTQTDRDGAFAFAYLPARPFSIVAVRDANRNRRIDPGEWVGVSPTGTVTADTAAAPVDEPWVLAPRDETPPAVRRVDALSDRRLAVRFTEPVVPTVVSGGGWTLADTTGSNPVAVRRVYRTESDPRTLHLVTDPMPRIPLRLEADRAAVDSAGTLLAAWNGLFVPSADPDTFVVRLVRVDADSLVVDGSARVEGALRLAPGSVPTLRFDHGPDPGLLRSALRVTDEAGSAVPFDVESDDGTAWRIRTDIPGGWRLAWRDSTDILLGPDSLHRYVPADEADLGELSGVVAAPDSVVVHLVPGVSTREPIRTVRPDRAGAFTFRRLPGGGRYRLRVFADLDGDGRWSPGTVSPWVRPEPLGWGPETPAVRARWDTVVPDTLRFGAPPPAERTETLRRDGPDSRM